MTYLLRELDPTLTFAVMLPIALAAAAWALRMACSICSVDPPDFWNASLCIVMIAVANVVIRFWVRVMHVDPGPGSQLIAPLLITAAIVAVSLRTGPITAFMVTVVEGLICGVLYIGLSMVGTAVFAAMLL